MNALIVRIEKYFLGIRNFFFIFWARLRENPINVQPDTQEKSCSHPNFLPSPPKKSLEKEILECTGRKEGGTISISASTTFRIFIFHFRLFFVAAAFVCGSYSRHSLERFFPFSFFSIWEVDVGLLN